MEKKEHETEIKDLFQKTLIVRSKGKEAQELADMNFLETLVRIHCAGEGMPYTGLKQAGKLDFAIVESYKALKTGKADELIKAVTKEAEEGIRKLYTNSLEKKKHADESVEAGREFVEAYVQFLHYTERLLNDMKASGEGHGHAEQQQEGHKEHNMKEQHDQAGQKEPEMKEQHHKHL